MMIFYFERVKLAKGTIIGNIFLKMGHPQPLFHLFLSFQANITILTTNKCEKCPSSLRRWDLNSQPLEHESPHITTRPGLRPSKKNFVFYILRLKPSSSG